MSNVVDLDDETLWTPEGLDEKVEAGALLLDRKAPGWASRIDVDILNLGCSEDCTLGQEFGEYDAGLQELELDEGSGQSSMMHGFDVHNPELYGALTALWKTEIAKRVA